MNRTELARIANAMVANNKGILSADESTGTIKKRLDAIKLVKAWGGTTASFGAGQKEFARRARLNGLATTGRYSADQEKQAA